ncbi:hypothetical protein [Parasitella parasitica]|uniref:Uncharacterized protein n=1 Tax=Parasitella parasitica TaxID=35722 RepID=A0A0B7NK30_9FUNG|nr:hypothetical protein [Parasitella parasitica]
MQAKLHQGFKRARFHILDFSLKKEVNLLLTVFSETDYKRFKAEFTTKMPVVAYLGNTSKSYLTRFEGAENKKQMIKLIKKEAMAVGDTGVNRYLDDDERSFTGPKINLIIKDKKYDLKFMIVEVSSPPQKTMFKHIASKMEVPSVTLITNLKLYGLQIYNNKAFIHLWNLHCLAIVWRCHFRAVFDHGPFTTVAVLAGIRLDISTHVDEDQVHKAL